MTQSQGRWIEIGGLLHEAACGYGGATAVLLAGWQGAAEARGDVEWIHATAVRGVLSQRLTGLASGVLWPLAGYLLSVAVVLMWPYAAQPSHRPPYDAMAVDATSIVAVSCLAYLVGRTVPLPVTPFVLVAALLLFGQSIWWTAITHPVEINYTGASLPQSTSGWVPARPPLWLPWCRAALFALLAAAAVSLCARWLPRGVHALLGPNGAGKSSLLAVLATAAAEGELRLLDRDPGSPAERREIRLRLGYLPQKCEMFRGFTVRECVGYAAWLKGMPGRAGARAVEHAVQSVGLGERIDKKYRSLSGGMQRRVGVAQALVNKPELLLLDEPTNGLDPEQREHLHLLLRELSVMTTVVMATHLMEDVEGCCNSVVVLKDARKVFAGSVDELRSAGGYTRVVADGPGGRP
ncbi:ATP-binding cassette domain-containing protein [Streptomyces sp. NPDC006446]|uniref:ATP-binding cassette domain-containing protein n=1 Tax=Streptomyces sp. NPDC006446 TaxID=3154301 RepID=UPI0033B4EDED